MLALFFAPLPRWRGQHIGPKTAVGFTRCAFQAHELVLAGSVLAIPPCVASFHEFVIQAAPIRQDHLTHDAPIAVEVIDVNGHPLAEDVLRGESPGFGSEALSLFWTIHSIQANPALLVLVENGQGIAIVGSHDLGGEIARARWSDDKQNRGDCVAKGRMRARHATRKCMFSANRKHGT
jgi:hypothetical protein